MQQQEKKSDEQQASAQTPASAASSNSQSGRPIPDVKTVQQADDLIAHDKQEIQSQQDYIQQQQKALATAPDSYKPRLQWRIQARGNIVSQLQNEIAAIEKEKNAMATQSTAGASSKPAAQPPQ